jgi:prevent-host-death family protein
MTISAAEFKEKCLKLMDDVRIKHHKVVITKRGKPVAQLVPVESATQEPLLGFLKGKATITGNIVDSIHQKWTYDAENI